MSVNTCSCQKNKSYDLASGEEKIESVCGCNSGNKSLKAAKSFNIVGNSNIEDNSIITNECCGGNCSCSN